MLKKEAKLRIEIKDFYHKFTKSKIAEIKTYYANYYNITEDDITIVRKYIQNETGEIGEIGEKASSVILDTVLDPKKLNDNYKKYLSNNFPEFNQNKFFEIDNEVASLMTKKVDEFDTKNRQYEVIYIRGKNLFSFEHFERYYKDNGITLIHSNPENGGGKSSLVRLLPFLIFGNELVYGHNKASYQRVFNRFTNEDEAYIEGEIKADGETYYLKRSLNRNTKGKVSHKFSIYKYDDNAPVDVDLGIRAINLNQKNAQKTLKKFKNIIGTYNDFVFASYYEYHNIEKWIQTKAKERYRLFCEYLGLGLIEEKYQIAKPLLNKHLRESLTSKYNVEEVQENVENLKTLINQDEGDVELIKQSVLQLENEIEAHNIAIKRLYKSRFPVETKYENFNIEDAENKVSQIQKEIRSVIDNLETYTHSLAQYDDTYLNNKLKEKTTSEIKELKGSLQNISKPQEYVNDIEVLEESIENIETPKYLQDAIEKLKENSLDLTNSIAGVQAEYKSLKLQLDNLPEFVVCKKCGAGEDTKQQKLDLEFKINKKRESIAALSDEQKLLEIKLANVKNKRNEYLAKEAKNIRKKITDKQHLINQHIKNQQSIIYEQIEEYEKILSNYNAHEKLVLLIKNQEQRKSTLQTTLQAQELEISEYLKNKEKIQQNKEISFKISEREMSIKSLNDKLFNHRSNLKSLENTVYHSKLKIEEKENLIVQLKADYEREKNLKLYLKVHGDDGISKHIILSILPQINSELALLFSEMNLDFELAIKFDDKKIEFMVEREGEVQPLNDYSGWEKTISCLALHYINVKMSTLPLPNTLILDEVLSRMNKVNFPKFVQVLKKLTEVFPTIDLITHSHSSELVKHIESSILITKENNISKIV